MIFKILLAIVSSIFYRAGGMSKEDKYFIPVWLRQGWVRDWLCPICTLIALIIKHPHLLFSWWTFLAYGLLGGALTTYWDEVPFNKGQDNFWMAGFFVGLALFPLAFAGISIWYILIRAAVMGVLWGGCNRIVNNNKVKHSDYVEEHFRGFVMVL